MVRNLLIAAAGLLIVGPSASAAPCRDAKGHFAKCPPAAAAKAKPVRCKDAKGKFAKCGATGAKPV